MKQTDTNQEIIKFLKIRDVKKPQRKFGDGGIDFFIPNYSEDFVKQLLIVNATKPLLVKSGVTQIKGDPPKEPIIEHIIVLPAHCDIKIPSGIRSWIDPNYVLMFTNKSGVAVNKRLDVSATTVDSSYQGEIHLCLTNTSDEPVVLNFGEKIVQGIVHQHYAGEFEVTEGDLSPESSAKFYEGLESHRKTGGFGSTGKE